MRKKPRSNGLEEKKDSFEIPKLGFSYLWRTGHFTLGQAGEELRAYCRGREDIKALWGQWEGVWR